MGAFDRQKRVDAHLLSDLKEAEEQERGKRSGTAERSKIKDHTAATEVLTGLSDSGTSSRLGTANHKL